MKLPQQRAPLREIVVQIQTSNSPIKAAQGNNKKIWKAVACCLLLSLLQPASNETCLWDFFQFSPNICSLLTFN